MPLGDVTVHALSSEEWAAMVDASARRHMGMSGAEFTQRWNDGEWHGLPENRRAMRVGMLLPLRKRD